MKIYLDRPLPTDSILPVRDNFWNHYVTTVRRVREGDSLEVVGNKTVATGTIDSLDPLAIQVESSRPINPPDYRLILCQAISRKSSFDDIVGNVSDLGVTDIVPVVTDRTVRRPNQPEKMRDRWRRIVLDSSRVSDRDWVTNVHPIMDWEDSLEFTDGAGTLFWGDPEGPPPAESFERGGEQAVLYVGPEGGFKPEEKQELRERGHAVSLGPENYRAGTAAMMISTLWLHTGEQI